VQQHGEMFFVLLVCNCTVYLITYYFLFCCQNNHILILYIFMVIIYNKYILNENFYVKNSKTIKQLLF